MTSHSHDQDNLQIARDMLEQYHLCRTNLAIREAILRRVIERHGEHSYACVAPQASMMEARRELAAVEMTILELMGVDS